MTSCNADDAGQGGVLHQGDDLVGHGGHDALDHLQQGDVEEDLGFGHAQHLACLLLALRHSLDAAPVDLGEVAGVIDDEGHDTRPSSARTHRWAR